MSDIEIFKKIILQLKNNFKIIRQSGVTRLTRPSIPENERRELYTLNEKGQIISINLSNRIENFDEALAYIKQLKHLKSLDLSLNGITSIALLTNFNNLETLRLDSNRITDFTALNKNPNLTSISIRSNLIDIVPDFNELTKLRTLDISFNKLSTLSPLKNLKNLKELKLAGNRIVDIFPLKELSELIEINLDDNNIVDISPIEYLTELNELRLERNKVIDISPIRKLTKLKKLYLSQNKIHAIDPLSNLKAIEILWLAKNGLNDIEPLMALENLKELELSNNNLKELPDPSSWNLKKLIFLNLRNNKIENIPISFFKIFSTHNIENIKYIKNIVVKQQKFEEAAYMRDIEKQMNAILEQAPDKEVIDTYVPGIESFFITNNPIKSPPIEIINQGRDAIQNYFKQLNEQNEDYLFEAKLLILGEPGAGKTSLAWKIDNSECELPKEDDTTKGIEVKQYYFPLQRDNFRTLFDQKGLAGRKFRLNIWDFGGQAIYKATHRFFLSKGSLYILVADNRNENTDFNYWLHIVEIFGGDSPLLIVLNEKHQRKRNIDITAMKSRFSNIKEVLEVDFAEANKTRLDKVLLSIRYYVSQLPHIGSPIPAKWSTIRESIVNDGRNTISLDDYISLCRTNGIKKIEDALTLSQYFHEIGVFLHFQEDDLLNKTIFLKPNWATNAVYKVLDHPILNQKQGRFDKEDAKIIWSDEEFFLVQNELLRLMQKFFLTYEIDNSRVYIVPERLPSERPVYEWHGNDNLYFRYVYGFFMPKGILSQFIVQLYYLISDNDLVWRNGVVMRRDEAVAEIIETYDGRSINVRISGKNKRDFMTIITNQLDRINSQFEKLDVKKLVPCNCIECRMSDNPHFYLFTELKTRIQKNRREIECSKSYEMVNVQSLLDEVYNENVNQPTGSKNRPSGASTNIKLKKIFISYSHKDKDVFERLRIHLNVLEREGVGFERWDDTQIKSGMKWKNEIEQALLTSQVAILLVSTDFLASDFITTNELPSLLHGAKNKGVEVLPLILAPSRFAKHKQLSEFQAVNDLNKPLSSLSFNEQEMVMLQLVSRIEEIIRD